MAPSELPVSLQRHPETGEEHITVGNIFVGPPVRRFPEGTLIKRWLLDSLEDLTDVVERFTAEVGIDDEQH